MYVHVHVHVCICTYMYICMYTRVHVHVHVYTYMYVYKNVHVYMYVYKNVHFGDCNFNGSITPLYFPIYEVDMLTLICMCDLNTASQCPPLALSKLRALGSVVYLITKHEFPPCPKTLFTILSSSRGLPFLFLALQFILHCTLISSG